MIHHFSNPGLVAKIMGFKWPETAFCKMKWMDFALFFPMFNRLYGSVENTINPFKKCYMIEIIRNCGNRSNEHEDIDQWWNPWCHLHDLSEIGRMTCPHIYIYVYIYIYLGVSINGGCPNSWMVYRENPIKNGWFSGTPIYGTPHVHVFGFSWLT